MTRHIHIGAFFQGVGHTIAWRHPDHAPHDAFETYAQFARLAERGLLDFIFFGEGLVVREHRGKFFGPIVNGRPDTIALLPALAAVTERVGLAATISSTYNQPYELARQLASIDHVSAGRAAWNVVTTFSNSAARDSGGDQVAYNFSKERHLAHATRYDRAREFVALIRQLWDSWEDDAFAGGLVNAAKIRAIDHAATWFAVRGPLDVPRPPQGHPVIIQAGQSDDGRDLAARIADVIFSPFGAIADSRAHYADIQARLVRYGRPADAVRVLPGVAVVTARSEREARDKAEAYRELLLTDVIRRYLLGEQSGMDFADVDLDGPLPDIAPDQPDVNGPLLARWQELSRTQGLSVRQIADTILSRPPIVGTPAQIADHFEHWVDTKASDGFLLTPTVFPNDLEDFVDLVVPELQARGRFRTAYTGTTLREHLQIARPTGQWARPSTLVAADA